MTVALPCPGWNANLCILTDWRQYLQRDPEICHGQLCAKGTRVLVTNILNSLADRATRKQMLKCYVSLKPEHIDSAIVYASELAREEALLQINNRKHLRLAEFPRPSLEPLKPLIIQQIRYIYHTSDFL
jgi:uncharacterized protein (DUF433 family)